MAETAGLLLRIKADGSQASQTMAEFRKDFQKTESELKARGSNISQIFQQVTHEMGLTGEQAAVLKKNAQQLGDVLSTVGSVIGSVVTGIAALGAAAVAVGVGIFELAKQSSDFGSRLFDVQQKTGLAAATLSTLDVAARQSGSSLEQVSSGAEKFSKLIGQAAEGSEKAKDTLKGLGVTSTDLNEALGQVFKTISDGRDGVEQIALAQLAFGKSGADLIPVIKQLNGDLDGATKAAKELGLTLTDNDLKAADDFGDTLNQLSAQAKTAATVFALQFAPVITEAMNSISKVLSDNRREARQWGESFADALRGAEIATASLVSGISYLSNAFNRLPASIRIAVEAFTPLINTLFAAYRLGQLTAQVLMSLGKQGTGTLGISGGVDPNLIGGVGGGKLPGLSLPNLSRGGGGRGGGGRASTEDPQRKAQEDSFNAQKTNLEILVKAYDTALEKIRKEFADTQDIDKFKEAIDKLRKESAANLQATVDAVNRLQLQLAKGGLTEAAKADIEKRLADLNDHLEKSYDKDEALIKESIKRKFKSWSNYIDDLEKKDKAYTDELQRQYVTRTESFNKYVEDLAARQKVYDDEQDRQAKERAERAKQDKLNRTVGSGQEISAIGQLSQMFSDTGNSAALIGIQTLTEAFQGLGQAVGQVVQAWVLYGSAGTSVRKVTAQILAGIAQQAAVKAIFELAEGFAALAMAFFGVPNAGPSATAHFAAAAIYGGIAGVAALAGRATAGNSFKQASAGGGAGANAGGANNNNLNDPNDPRNNFRSPFAGDRQQQNEMTDRQNTVLGLLAEHVQKLHEKITSMSPGDVVAIGAPDAKSHITQAVQDHLAGSLTTPNAFRRLQGEAA